MSVLGIATPLLKDVDVRPRRARRPRRERLRASPTSLGLGRVLIGTTMLFRPAELGKTHGVDPASSERTAWAVQMLGARDVALGVGTVLAARSADKSSLRPWLVAGLIADAGDALAIGWAAGRGRVRTTPGVLSVAMATASVAYQVGELVRDPGRRSGRGR